MKNQIQQPQFGKKLKAGSSKSYCMKVTLWILTLLIWAGIICSLIVSNLGASVGLICMAIFLYIAYLCFEFRSDTIKIISNIKSPKQIYDILDKIFKNPVIITFCHEIYETITERDNEGKESTRERYIKSLSEKFNIYSTRDISGTFNFYNGNNSYLLLELDKEINFADAVSYSDYEKEKNNFKNRKVSLLYNEYKIFKERIEIEGMNQDTYFININGENNCFISKGVFIIFTILTLGEIYKLIVRGLATNQTFIIKKIISTRYDLSQNNEYDSWTPKLNFPNKEYKFDLKNTFHINNNMEVNKPTPEELTKSMKYQQYIPNYKNNNNNYYNYNMPNYA